jgi:hypothetical protein
MSLTLTSGIFGVEQEVKILNPVLEEPKDGESIEEYRRKIERAYNTISHGGRKADYRLWAVDISGIVEVYPYSALSTVTPNDPQIVNLGLGFPRIFIEFKDNKPEEQVYIDYKNEIIDKAPLAGGQIVLLPCEILKLCVGLSDVSGDIEEIKNLAEQKINELFLRIRPYISGVDLEPKNIITPNEIYMNVYEFVKDYGNFSGLLISRMDPTSLMDPTPLPAPYTLSAGEIPLLHELKII